MGEGDDASGKHPMLADMRRQPTALAGLLARAGEIQAAGWAARSDAIGRVYAFGSGDGWFAARAATDFARQRRNLCYKGASALQMLAYCVPVIGPADLAVAISMSGTA